ncbi:prolyl oligopeptidase family serine peptidase [Actinomadura graeca]|uniref:Prolyl oligopeptidase family serine peptidase n=1 Tax=Actinomadura graeca TaxID=2750812 RepID=A0ABX8R3Q4_9ACTN|nr:prolyl oligopeptidase family serine peptidase [Actinomadura graeca]QXJ25664.1 prolyl oligopeptidase family serine peptidase [Actinomadura graeca]
MKMRTGVAIAASAALLGMTAGMTPASARETRLAEVIKDVAYAPAQPATSKGHLLDLYLPAGGEARPLVIWTAGSAWQRDDGKSRADSFAGVLNARGYAVAGVSIRSSSQAQFPAQVYDFKAAIRFLRANAAKYRLDPKRFAYMGDSSGGWTTQMATLTGGEESLEGDIGTTGQPSNVQAGVAFYGVSDLSKLGGGGGNSPQEKLLGCAVTACKEKAAQASPITHVDKSDPPLMLLHGQADSVVNHEQSVMLYQALKASCRETQFISVPDANHNMNDVMNPSRFGKQTGYTVSNCKETVSNGSPNPTWDHIITFLDTALGTGVTRSHDHG